MAQRMNEQGLERDWGYLMRFLDKLEAQAVGMPTERREKLLTLVASKRRICDGIRELLAGVDTAVTADGPKPVMTESTPRSSGVSLTVGSLL